MTKTAQLFDSLVDRTVNLSGLIKYLPVTATTAMITALKLVVERYIFSDWNFLYFLLVAVGVDTMIGSYVSIKQKKFDFKKLGGGIFEKMLLYMAFLVITHVVISFTVQGKANGLFGWLDDAMYSFLIIVELLSVFKSAYTINPKYVPTKIRAYFEDFNDKGELIPKNEL